MEKVCRGNVMEECQVFKQSMTLAVTIFNVNTMYGVHISYEGKGTDLVIKDNLTKFILIDKYMVSKRNTEYKFSLSDFIYLDDHYYLRKLYNLCY